MFSEQFQSSVPLCTSRARANQGAVGDHLQRPVLEGKEGGLLMSSVF